MSSNRSLDTQKTAATAVPGYTRFSDAATSQATSQTETDSARIALQAKQKASINTALATIQQGSSSSSQDHSSGDPQAQQKQQQQQQQQQTKKPKSSEVLARAQEINRKFLMQQDPPVTSHSSSSSNKNNDINDNKIEVNSLGGASAVSSQRSMPVVETKEPAAAAHQDEPQEEQMINPEILVDALSGHEDGLLAIAERLMEHYDGGYDVMGEAIIDAFADVQKLFQHVVEAAHMEGAAYEANRAREERQRAGHGNSLDEYDVLEEEHTDEYTEFRRSPDKLAQDQQNVQGIHSSNSRHDEIIDSDVRDILRVALKDGTKKMDAKEYVEAYAAFEAACQHAAALLPVDSDHRGRLTLSIARAEMMSPERGCTILRYAMDDVLRSGLNFKNSSSDESQRNDYRQALPSYADPEDDSRILRSSSEDRGKLATVSGAFNKKKALAESIRMDTHKKKSYGNYSPEEALSTIVAEFKDVISAPMYKNSPVQRVSRDFLNILSDVQIMSVKQHDKLEEELAQCKAELLMARADYEEKIADITAELEELKKNSQPASLISSGSTGGIGLAVGGGAYMDQARGTFAKFSSQKEASPIRDSNKASSVASGLAAQAKAIAATFNCYDPVRPVVRPPASNPSSGVGDASSGSSKKRISPSKQNR